MAIIVNRGKILLQTITTLFKVETSVGRNKITDTKNPSGLHVAENFSPIIGILLLCIQDYKLIHGMQVHEKKQPG